MWLQPGHMRLQPPETIMWQRGTSATTTSLVGYSEGMHVYQPAWRSASSIAQRHSAALATRAACTASSRAFHP